ncbi:MAG TPA: hypothetical protein DEF07_03340 [Nitrosomonas sp.]|uniref:Uncharacterized protein n=1 Tax=Nitrosomonas mobilis TaxID=51642 RepID=A0A1G5SCY9_9PROT|nr:hypothetical protein [Nitrosomonas mobilis]SCZ85055.1 conserved hypothetical protein [Nitrosomonas mobilis]HBV20738.1 hypothetical protein [Nitrosomonas sp.]
MEDLLILSKSVLESIKDTTLFYPCSGNDLLIPIEFFSPYVTDFWFVDKGYFSPRNKDTRNYGLDAPADKQEPLLRMDQRYNLLERKINGPVSCSSYDKDIDPCTLTEIYRHNPTGRIIKINRRNGYGFSAFRKEISTLGVFFYRGDSLGEGGSGNLWLLNEHINDVCLKLIDVGLIVSDGSNPGMRMRKKGIYREFWKYRETGAYSEENYDPEYLIKSMRSFNDYGGREFNCVGYAGHRYGPTMIWQVCNTLGNYDRNSSNVINELMNDLEEKNLIQQNQ